MLVSLVYWVVRRLLAVDDIAAALRLDGPIVVSHSMEEESRSSLRPNEAAFAPSIRLKACTRVRPLTPAGLRREEEIRAAGFARHERLHSWLCHHDRADADSKDGAFMKPS